MNLCKNLNKLKIEDVPEDVLKEWLKNRDKSIYKCNIDILSKKNIKKLYDSFANNQKTLLNIESKLNTKMGRLPNFPDNISENLVLQILKIKYPNENWSWNCKKGDIFENTKKIQGEVKAHQNGPTSFTPNKNIENDTLFFLDVSKHLDNDYIKLYRIDKYYSILKNIKVNSIQTFEEQQNQGRRARIDFTKFPDLNNYIIWSGKINDLLN